MSLQIEIDRTDYSAACREVQEILARIQAVPISEDEADLENVPSADEIVDAVWDAIR